MTPSSLLQVAAELRERAAAAGEAERAELLFLAQEYETSARDGFADKAHPFSVILPK